jgi:hypothetical protein
MGAIWQLITYTVFIQVIKYEHELLSDRKSVVLVVLRDRVRLPDPHWLRPNSCQRQSNGPTGDNPAVRFRLKGPRDFPGPFFKGDQGPFPEEAHHVGGDGQNGDTRTGRQSG